MPAIKGLTIPVCLLSTLTAVVEPAGAAEFEPFIVGALLLDMEDDWVIAANDPADETNSLYPVLNLATVFGLLPHTRINLGLTFKNAVEPVGNNYFADLGLYARYANVGFTVGELELFAGKFEPRFGRAWDITPGIYGNDLTTDYQLIEMVGVGGTYSIGGGAGGSHVLGASAFFADTTVLSESLFSNRGRLTLFDGGPANTGRLDNFTVTLDGSDIAAMPGLSYNLGFARLAAGRGDLADQTGYVLGLAKSTALTPRLTLTLNGEIAHFDNFGGTRDDGTYYTLAAELARERWRGVLATTILERALAGGGSETTSLLQVSGGYTFDNGLDVDLGYAFTNEAGDFTHMVGIELRRQFGFSTPGAPDIDFDITDQPIRGDSAVIPR